MKDQQKNKTSELNRRNTGTFEQIPSSQKRNLRTGQLANPFTQPANEDNGAQAQMPELASAPVSNPNPPATNPPATPTLSYMSAQPTVANQSAPTTSLIEAAATSNHQVVKAPANPDPIPAPAPPPAHNESVTGMNVREIHSINTAEARSIGARLEAEHHEPKPVEAKAEIKNEFQNLDTTSGHLAREFKEVKATTPVQNDIPAKPAAKAMMAGVTAATEVVDLPLPVIGGRASDKPSEVGDLTLFNSMRAMAGEEITEPRTTKDKIKSIAFYATIVVMLLGTAMAVVVYVPQLRERVQERLPARFASLLGGKTKELPVISVQADPIIYDEKEKTATLSGVVTNLSDAPLGPINLEFTLSNRNDVRLTENKVISVEPSPIAPGTTGKYQFTIAAKDFQDSKLVRILNNNQSVKFKNLGVKDAPAVYENPQQPNGQPNNGAPKDKPADNSVYDGTVTFK